MSINYDTYKQKAIDAIREVFVNEYRNSIGIPLPEIDFILPDSIDYKTGQYYITIDETWQIHLNFGLLPISYKEFHQEVKVLTRHEVEHYMCCPFDVITHFRMLKVIIDTYNKHYSFHKIKIISLAGNIANQVADIIIDTKNFNKHKAETIKSEINWIKKGDDIHKFPRHSKLMFLMKETLWKENLELNETDEELLKEVQILSEKFREGGIENKDLFFVKVEAYTHLFFKLFEQDQKEEHIIKLTSGGKVNEQYNGQDQSNNEQINAQPQIIPSKNSEVNGSQFIFQSPDKIQDALVELAQETSIEHFNQILLAAGFKSLSEKDKERIWFEAQNTDMITIEETVPVGSNDNYSYPTSWKLGDPIEDIDMMLTFATSPIFIPGVTTKKWKQNTIFNTGSEKKQRDLLLVIDTSGSMGDVINQRSNIHQAVLASYGIIRFFESNKSQVALIGFSDKVTVDIEWTKDYNEVRENILLSGNGGTYFPINKIQKVIEVNKNQIVTVVITDGEIKNTSEAIDYFKDYLTDGNKLFIFLQDTKNTIEHYEALINYGAKVFKTLTAKEMRDSVLIEIL